MSNIFTTSLFQFQHIMKLILSFIFDHQQPISKPIEISLFALNQSNKQKSKSIQPTFINWTILQPFIIPKTATKNHRLYTRVISQLIHLLSIHHSNQERNNKQLFQPSLIETRSLQRTKWSTNTTLNPFSSTPLQSQRFKYKHSTSHRPESKLTVYLFSLLRVLLSVFRARPVFGPAGCNSVDNYNESVRLGELARAYINFIRIYVYFLCASGWAPPTKVAVQAFGGSPTVGRGGAKVRKCACWEIMLVNWLIWIRFI